FPAHLLQALLIWVEPRRADLDEAPSSSQGSLEAARQDGPAYVPQRRPSAVLAGGPEFLRWPQSLAQARQQLRKQLATGLGVTNLRPHLDRHARLSPNGMA